MKKILFIAIFLFLIISCLQAQTYKEFFLTTGIVKSGAQRDTINDYNLNGNYLYSKIVVNGSANDDSLKIWTSLDGTTFTPVAIRRTSDYTDLTNGLIGCKTNTWEFIILTPYAIWLRVQLLNTAVYLSNRSISYIINGIN